MAAVAEQWRENRPTAGARVLRLGELWSYRELVYFLALRDVKSRYKQAFFGIGWTVFQPIVGVAIFTVVFRRLAEVPSEGVPYSVFALLGFVIWSYFAGSFGNASGSLVANASLVTKIYFPREVLPVSVTLGQAVDFAVGVVVLTVGLVLLHPPAMGAALLWVVPLVAILFAFTTACALFLSCANLFFRDVKYIVQVVLTFGVLFTPVFFDASMVGPGARRIVMLNPLSAILEGLRLAVVDGHNLLVPLMQSGVELWRPADLAYSAGVAVVALIGSALLFHRAEFVFAEYV